MRNIATQCPRFRPRLGAFAAGLCTLTLVSTGCATAEMSVDDAKDPEQQLLDPGGPDGENLRPLAATEVMLRVHYPVPTGKSLSVRGAGGSLRGGEPCWMSSIRLRMRSATTG